MISFIIPAYNASKYIGNCLASLVEQSSDLEYEALVIDDGSKDNTREIVKEWEEKDARIRYFYKENGGVSSARNYGLQVSKGDYIAFIDSDDYISKDCFANMKGYEDYDLSVYGYFYKTEKHTFPVTDPAKREQYEDVKEGFMNIYRANMFNCVWNKIYKKELITATFDENYVMGEDLLFNIEYYKNVKSVKMINEPLYYYVVTNGSATQKYRENYIYNFVQTYQKLLELRDKLGIQSYPEIDVAFLDNVTGTLRLLVVNNSSKYSKEEMQRIYQVIENIPVSVKSRDKFSNLIFDLFKGKHFGMVYCLIRTKQFIKSII